MKLPVAAVLVLCLVSSLAVSNAHAQTTAAQNRTRDLAVVSFNALVLQTNEAQRDLGVLEAKFSPRQTQLQTLSAEIEASRKDLTDNGDKLGDQERAARTEVLNTKEKQLQRLAEDFRSDSQNEAQEAFQRVAQKVFAFVQDYGRQHAYTAIIDRGPDTAPVVWYAADEIDITSQLLKAYNAKSGIPAAESKATPAQPKTGSGTPANALPAGPSKP